MGIFFPCLGSQLFRQYLFSTAPPPAQTVEIPMVFTLGEQAGLGSARLLCKCVVQTLSPVRLFVTPWTAARQASLSFTITWSLLRLKCIESVMPPTISYSVVPFSFCLQSFPASGSFLMSLLLAKSLQSCPTRCNPIDGSPPGSPVPGILQARTLEWVAISFSNA